MNRLVFPALAALGLAPAAKADPVDVSTAVGFESRYVFRGIQFAETSIQPAINLGLEGFYLNAWFNLPIGDDDLVVTPGGEELDLVAGYSAPLGDALTVDVGVTYYMFPDVMSGFADVFKEDEDGVPGNTVEPYVGLALSAPLSPSFYVYRDFFLDTTTLQGNLSHSFPLAEKTSFDVAGFIGYVFDDAGGVDYLYGAASADVSYVLTDNGSVYAGVRYGGSDIAGGAIIDDSIAGSTKASGFWWGLGFNASF